MASAADPSARLVSAATPLALLPVRLETRFSTDGGTWLLIRVFPDDVHLDQRKEIRPAVARLLPDAWIALGYRDDRRGDKTPGGALFAVTGNPIPAELPVVPDPGKMTAGAPADPIAARVDPAFRWVVDFAAAEQVGMALRVAIDADILSRGLDRLIVLGVRKAAGDDTRLADLLAAHRASDGAALLPIGTPTNHTAEAAAGTADAPAATADRDADRAEAALGLPAGTLTALPRGDVQQLAPARAMNAALWPVTWRYFLEQMMVTAGGDTALVPPAAIDWLHGHFVEHVRADGPLPALRIGRQPYGLLPVTTLAQWPRGGDPGARLAALLRSLVARLFRPALASVPRLTAGALLDETVAQILGQQAHGYRYAGRPLLGAAYLRNLAVLMRWKDDGPTPPPTRDALTWSVRPAPPARDDDIVWTYKGATASPATVAQRSWDPGDPRGLLGWLDAQEKTATALLQAVLGDLGVHARPRLGRSAFTADRFAIQPLVAGSTAADLAALDADDRKPADLRAAHPRSLLEALVRHAVLLECGVAARRRAPWVEPELVNLGVALAVAPQPTLAQLRAIPEADGLRDLHAALTALARLSAAELTRLASGTLDLCSHRLDAWITSLAALRLDQLRARSAGGLALGGYGWVTDLRPHPGAPPVPDEVIHAPSLAHATTAAILRAGYQAHRDDGGALAVDLSSARMRRARGLLDAVRAGQTPAALLGYGFERGLAEREQPGRLLRQYIAPLRRLAPLAGALALPAGPAESIAAHDVVDGIALARIWRANRGVTPLPLGATASFEARIFAVSIDDDYATIAGKHAGDPAHPADAGSEYLFGVRRGASPQHGFLCLIWHTAGAGGFGTPACNVAQASVELPLNRWVHVAAVRDRAGVTLYVDGHPVPSTGTPDALPFRTGAPPLSLRLGAQARPAAGARRFHGRLREVRLWNVARSAADILRGSTGALTAVEAGLAGYWRFDEITGDGALDRSPYGNHGAFVNGQPPWVAVTDDPGWAGGSAALELGGGAFVEIAHQPVLSLGPVPGLPADPADQALVAAALDQLLDDADAASDLALAEAIHQVALGNAPRAAATLEAMASGSVPPPDPEVLRTPRGAVAHTQRVMAWLSDGGGAAAGWPTDARQVRAVAEPRINEWAARLLGPARRVWYRVDFLDAQGKTLASGEHDLGDLRLSALDVVHLAPGELTARILAAHAGDAPAAAELRVDGERAASWGADRLSLRELTELAAAIKRVLAAARAMTGADLVPPASGPPPADAIDAAELSGRVARVQAQLTALRGKLDGDPGALRDTLAGLAGCGIPGCVAPPRAGATELAARAGAAAAEVDRRLARAHGAADDASRLAELLGDGFRAVPRLVLTADAAAGLTAALRPGHRGGWNGPEMRRQLWRWLSAHARVRDAMSRLDDLLLYDTAVNDAAVPLAAAQLPAVDGEPWVGLARADAVAGSRLSLVVLASGDPDPGRLAAGLVLDEWVDTVPRPTHTTGVAFHCDSPGATPPHAILLAVPPDDRPQWDLAGLEAVVRETMELFQIRMVGPRALGPAAQFLPATLLAYNPAGEAISTDLTALSPTPG